MSWRSFRASRASLSRDAERVVLALPALALLAVAALRAPRTPAIRVAEARPAPAASGRRVLRVCADPNNLPFSNERGEGFENRLASLLARELHADLRYTWWAQRRGFTRNTLRAGMCDLVPGIPTSFELVLATRPYYRSTYVFVYRRDARFRLRSFDDSVLRRLKIGVHFIGDDGANAPPAHALGARGITANVTPFSLYGDYAKPNPPARILEAVADGRIDVAIVWGPLAGYFASRQKVPLTIVPVSPQVDVPFLPFVYDISMGVRRDDPGLKTEVEEVLRRRRATVDSILTAFGVPRVGRPGAATAAGVSR
jgi:mxaJ protein